MAKDVCEALELVNTSRAIAALEDDEVRIQNLNTNRGTRDHSVISESGLYALIVRSTKPSAKRFRKWVTSEVLPSIRKNGMYMAPSVAKEAVESPDDFLARAVLVADEGVFKL